MDSNPKMFPDARARKRWAKFVGRLAAANPDNPVFQAAAGPGRSAPPVELGARNRWIAPERPAPATCPEPRRRRKPRDRAGAKAAPSSLPSRVKPPPRPPEQQVGEVLDLEDLEQYTRSYLEAITFVTQCDEALKTLKARDKAGRAEWERRRVLTAQIHHLAQLSLIHTMDQLGIREFDMLGRHFVLVRVAGPKPRPPYVMFW